MICWWSLLNLQFINRDSENTYYINWTKNAEGSPRRISYNTFLSFFDFKTGDFGGITSARNAYRKKETNGTIQINK